MLDSIFFFFSVIPTVKKMKLWWFDTSVAEPSTTSGISWKSNSPPLATSAERSQPPQQRTVASYRSISLPNGTPVKLLSLTRHLSNCITVFTTRENKQVSCEIVRGSRCRSFPVVFFFFTFAWRSSDFFLSIFILFPAKSQVSFSLSMREPFGFYSGRSRFKTRQSVKKKIKKEWRGRKKRRFRKVLCTVEGNAGLVMRWYLEIPSKLIKGEKQWKRESRPSGTKCFSP